MCHLYPDPDAFIQQVQENIACSVVRMIVRIHQQNKEPPVPKWVTSLGLVFSVNYSVHIDAASIAGKKIIQELDALGFVCVSFYDSEETKNCTTIEYTLTSLANFEEYRYIPE